MTIPIIILVAIFLIGLGCGAGAWFIFRRRLAVKDKELAKQTRGNKYIISARSDKQGMEATAKEVGIPLNHIYATGSNKAKVEKIKELSERTKVPQAVYVREGLDLLLRKYEEKIDADPRTLLAEERL